MPESFRFRTAGIIFFVSFLTYACFLQDPNNSNVSSRMFLTLSIVGHGELSIDRYAAKTADRAVSHGKFYSDKAPGLSLMAIPVTTLLWRPIINSSLHRTDEFTAAGGWPPAYYLFTYFANLSTSVFITALSVAAIFLVALSVFGNPTGAIFTAVAYGFATPAFGWATAFFGHAPAMGLLMIGFTWLYLWRPNNGASLRDFLFILIGVACLAWAVVTEFTAGPVAVAVAVYHSKKILSVRNHRPMLLVCALVTVLVVTLPLLIYNHLAFGSPWSLGYKAVDGFPEMKQGFFGISTPKLSALYEITFGPRCGIFQICPLLLFVPIGLLQMSSRDEYRALALLITFIVLYYLGLNSSFYYYAGGWSTGPRYITGMLPFACLALGSVWNSASRQMRAVVFLVFLISLALALICVSTTMYAPNDYSHRSDLLPEFLIPAFLGGYSTGVPVHLFGFLPRTLLIGVLLLWIFLAIIFSHQLKGLRQS
jgi:hypothetical protein